MRYCSRVESRVKSASRRGESWIERFSWEEGFKGDGTEERRGTDLW